MSAERKVWDFNDGPNSPLGHGQVTVGTSAVNLPSVPADAKRALIRALSNPINWRDDGVNPTGTTGFPMLTDEALVYDGNPSLFKMIRASTATADVDVRVAYYGD